MDGRLVVERGTIYRFLELVLATPRNRSAHSRRAFSATIAFTRSITSRNNPWRARRNVAHHYDLDRRLYELFLDADQQYSCAYFERPDDTLEEAQAAKKRLVTAKLLVSRKAACSTSAAAGAGSGFTSRASAGRGRCKASRSRGSSWR